MLARSAMRFISTSCQCEPLHRAIPTPCRGPLLYLSASYNATADDLSEHTAALAGRRRFAVRARRRAYIPTLRKRRPQHVGVVAAAVDDAVDEQGRRPQHLARFDSALHVPLDALERRRTPPVAVEPLEVELQLGRIAPQIV